MLDEGELGLDEQHEAAVARYEQVTARIEELTELRRTAERERSTWTARREALAMGLTRKDGAGALLAAGPRLPGLLGSVAALLSVEPGYEAAVAAALGAVADAVAVASSDDVSVALELLKADDAGRAGVLVGVAGSADTPRHVARMAAPRTGPNAGAGRRCPLGRRRHPRAGALRAPLHRALDRVAVVADLPMRRWRWSGLMADVFAR